MLVTTTPTVEGHVIKAYHGVVCGEAILGANIVRDLFASITDIVGGRAAAYEQELGRAREIALQEMRPGPDLTDTSMVWMIPESR